MLDDFQFDEDFDDDNGDFGEDLPPEDGGNRTFLMVAGGIGVIMVIALILLIVYATVIAPGRNNGTADASANETVVAQNATTAAQNEALAQNLTATAVAQSWTSTPTQTLAVTNTATPEAETPTPDGTIDGGDTSPTAESAGADAGAPTADPRTATVESLLTQAAVAQTQAAAAVLTVTSTPTPTGALPDTGFIDDIGVPGLMAMAAVLILIVFGARRLRQVNS